MHGGLLEGNSAILLSRFRQRPQSLPEVGATPCPHNLHSTPIWGPERHGANLNSLMATTPGASDAPGASGGRPPALPPTPQCLFPPEIKTGSAVVPIETAGGSIDDGLLESVLSVLATTYDEQEVRERLSPTFVHGVHALLSARSAGWLTTYEFEEKLLKLFTLSAAPAARTSRIPSPADSTSGGLGAQVATATARVSDYALICERVAFGRFGSVPWRNPN